MIVDFNEYENSYSVCLQPETLIEASLLMAVPRKTKSSTEITAFFGASGISLDIKIEKRKRIGSCWIDNQKEQHQ